ERGKGAGGDHRGPAQLPGHPLADAIDQSHVAKHQAGLDGVDRVLADDMRRLDEFNAGKLGGILEKSLHRDGNSWADGTPQILPASADRVEGGGGSEVANPQHTFVFVIGGYRIDDAIRPNLARI